MTVQELFDTINIETEYDLLTDNLTRILWGNKTDNFNRQILRLYTVDDILKIVTTKTIDEEEADRTYALRKNSAEQIKDMCAHTPICNKCRFFMENNECMFNGTPENWIIKED